MRVLITGGSGFIGTMLAKRLLQLGKPPAHRAELSQSTASCCSTRPTPQRPLDDHRLRHVRGAVTDAELVRTAVDQKEVSAFHLAAMVSSACEADFDSALRTNLDGTRTVLEAARDHGDSPRVIFASSIAAFGGDAAVARSPTRPS